MDLEQLILGREKIKTNEHLDTRDYLERFKRKVGTRRISTFSSTRQRDVRTFFVWRNIPEVMTVTLMVPDNEVTRRQIQ